MTENITIDDELLAKELTAVMNSHGFRVSETYCRLILEELKPEIIKAQKEVLWSKFRKKMLEIKALGISLGVVEE